MLGRKWVHSRCNGTLIKPMWWKCVLCRAIRKVILYALLPRRSRAVPPHSADYERLLAGLIESREHLRVMQVSGEQQVVDLAKAFYRIESAAAAIRDLLNQIGHKQAQNGAMALN